MNNIIIIISGRILRVSILVPLTHPQSSVANSIRNPGTQTWLKNATIVDSPSSRPPFIFRMSQRFRRLSSYFPMVLFSSGCSIQTGPKVPRLQGIMCWSCWATPRNTSWPPTRSWCLEPFAMVWGLPSDKLVYTYMFIPLPKYTYIDMYDEFI